MELEKSALLYTFRVVHIVGFEPHKSLPLTREVAKIFDF